jgi:hypothetical protein
VPNKPSRYSFAPNLLRYLVGNTGYYFAHDNSTCSGYNREQFCDIMKHLCPVWGQFSQTAGSEVKIVEKSNQHSIIFPLPLLVINYSDPQIIVYIYVVPCWRYLLGITDSATQSFTLFIYFRLRRRYYTTVELEFSNGRLSISRTLVFVDWLFSSILRLLG